MFDLPQTREGVIWSFLPLAFTLANQPLPKTLPCHALVRRHWPRRYDQLDRRLFCGLIGHRLPPRLPGLPCLADLPPIVIQIIGWVGKVDLR